MRKNVVYISELSKKEKEEYMRVLLEKDIQFE